MEIKIGGEKSRIKSPISPLFDRGGTRVQHPMLQSGNLNDFLEGLGFCALTQKGMVIK